MDSYHNTWTHKSTMSTLGKMPLHDVALMHFKTSTVVRSGPDSSAQNPLLALDFIWSKNQGPSQGLKVPDQPQAISWISLPSSLSTSGALHLLFLLCLECSFPDVPMGLSFRVTFSRRLPFPYDPFPYLTLFFSVIIICLI